MIKKILYQLPRGLSVLFIAFISMFALDVFGQPQWFLALLIHLIPSFILTALTVIAWKNERVGGWIFVVVGFSLLVLFRLEMLILSGPVIVLGLLFLNRGRLKSL